MIRNIQIIRMSNDVILRQCNTDIMHISLVLLED